MNVYLDESGDLGWRFDAPYVDYNALLSLSRGSILTEVVLFWGLFLESIFLF